MPCLCVNVWDAQQRVFRCELCGATEPGDASADEMLRLAERELAKYCAQETDEAAAAAAPREIECAAAATAAAPVARPAVKRRARRNETESLRANARAFLAYDRRVAARTAKK